MCCCCWFLGWFSNYVFFRVIGVQGLILVCVGLVVYCCLFLMIKDKMLNLYLYVMCFFFLVFRKGNFDWNRWFCWKKICLVAKKVDEKQRNKWIFYFLFFEIFCLFIYFFGLSEREKWREELPQLRQMVVLRLAGAMTFWISGV